MKSEELRDGILRAEGDIDFRGTLGVSKDAPVIFQTLQHFPTIETMYSTSSG